MGANKLTLARFVEICKLLNLSTGHLLGERETSLTDYGKLFSEDIRPMWLFDPMSLRFLDVNKATSRTYGYTRHDFLSMTICDIRPYEDVNVLRSSLRTLNGDKHFDVPFRHQYRNGVIQSVHIQEVMLVDRIRFLLKQ